VVMGIGGKPQAKNGAPIANIGQRDRCVYSLVGISDTRFEGDDWQVADDLFSEKTPQAGELACKRAPVVSSIVFHRSSAPAVFVVINPILTAEKPMSVYCIAEQIIADPGMPRAE